MSSRQTKEDARRVQDALPPPPPFDDEAISQTKSALLASQLRADIKAGRYGLGDKLPSQRDLEADTGVSRITVRAAYQQLEAEGLIENVPTRGAFVRSVPGWSDSWSVTEARPAQPAPVSRAAEDLRAVEDPVKWHHQADADTAAMLSLPEHAPVFGTERLNETRTGERVQVKTVIPFSTVVKIPALADDPFVPLADVATAARDGRLTIEHFEAVTATMPTPDEQRALRVPDNTPILVTRATLTHDGKPIAVEETRRNAARTHLQYRYT